MITSDAHSGLKAALQAIFPTVKWQRCQFHLQQNAGHHVPKQNMREEVAADLKIVFNAPDRKEADRYLQIVVKKYQEKASDLSIWMRKMTRKFDCI